MDKKKLTAAISAINSALKKGYDLLNENGQMQEVQTSELAPLAGHILKALTGKLAQVLENEQFEGMTVAEIVEKKASSRREELAELKAKAGRELKELKAVPEVETEEDPDLDVDSNPATDKEPDADQE